MKLVELICTKQGSKDFQKAIIINANTSDTERAEIEKFTEFLIDKIVEVK